MKRHVSGGLLAPLAVIAFLAAGIALGQESAVMEPATLVVWNRTIAVFRAPVMPPRRTSMRLKSDASRRSHSARV